MRGALQKSLAGRGRKREFKPEYCDLIIKLAEQGKFRNAFCKEIRCGTQVFYRFKEEVSDFAEAVDIAIAIYQDWWEEKGRLGMDNGRNFNSTAWIFFMKNKFPDEYGEKSILETINKTAKTTFIAPDQYNDLEEWSKAYQEDK